MKPWNNNKELIIKFEVRIQILRNFLLNSLIDWKSITDGEIAIADWDRRGHTMASKYLALWVSPLRNGVGVHSPTAHPFQKGVFL